ncbi:MAG: rhodanese-like domain-containing protein, partial [Rhodothermales bacterium]
RIDRSAFMAGHVPGALYAPMNRTFNTVVGSYVEEETPIYLIIEEDQVEEAVRDLVRIGLDTVVGYATPEVLARYRDEGGALGSIPEIRFENVEALRHREDVTALDVRGIAEYRTGCVPGAYNVAYTRLSVRKEEVPLDKTLLVYCRTGARAAVASAFLACCGYTVQYVNDDIANGLTNSGVADDRAMKTAMI